jgi:arabinofuranosyltransferase
LWVVLLALWRVLGGHLEIGSVVLGLLLSAVGVLAAQLGAQALARRVGLERDASPLDRRAAWLSLPLGMVVYAALPVAWDFVTSGLETGLTLAWLGGTFWLVARLPGATGGAPFWTAAAVGLGPLVRPDLAVFSVAFLVVLCVPDSVGGRVGGRRVAGLALAAVALPLFYQILRMGYFATLVPNTALAKEAGDAHWNQGYLYLKDFVGTYALWLPVSLLAIWWAAAVRHAWRQRARQATALLVAPVLAALVHALYVVRVGGDFMHGRLLLPTLFAMLLVGASVPWRAALGRRWTSIAAIGVVGWSLACALFLRIPYPGGIGPLGIADERGFYAGAGHRNPITVEDYRGYVFERLGRQARDLMTRGRVLFIDGGPGGLPLADWVRRSTQIVVALPNVGLAGYIAGPSVHVVDMLGLADPIASRLVLLVRHRPGHEKRLPGAWVAARFAEPGAARAAYPEAAAALDVLRCGDVATLLRAIEEPLTVRGFVKNVSLAWTLRALRIPPDPAAARAALCR